MTEPQELRRRLPAGIAVGLLFATLYGARAVALYLVRGGAPFAAHGVSLGAVLAAYLGAGIAAGALYGALFPLRRSLPGQLILGVGCAAVVYTGIGVATAGWPWRWGALEWHTLALCAIVMRVGAPLVARRVW